MTSPSEGGAGLGDPDEGDGWTLAVSTDPDGVGEALLRIDLAAAADASLRPSRPWLVTLHADAPRGLTDRMQRRLWATEDALLAAVGSTGVLVAVSTDASGRSWTFHTDRSERPAEWLGQLRGRRVIKKLRGSVDHDPAWSHLDALVDGLEWSDGEPEGR